MDTLDAASYGPGPRRRFKLGAQSEARASLAAGLPPLAWPWPHFGLPPPPARTQVSVWTSTRHSFRPALFPGRGWAVQGHSHRMLKFCRLNLKPSAAFSVVALAEDSFASLVLAPVTSRTFQLSYPSHNRLRCQAHDSLIFVPLQPRRTGRVA